MNSFKIHLKINRHLFIIEYVLYIICLLNIIKYDIFTQDNISKIKVLLYS
jgi:hypothetical protein